jgi:hypothetical protein
MSPRSRLIASTLILAGMLLAAPSIANGASAFIAPFNTIDTLASTVPKNRDVNPYGVSVVPRTRGQLIENHVLVSNFNNHRNLQGTGNTIVQIAPDGTSELFAEIAANKLPGPCPGGIGLTTALVSLRSGWVIVGSLPTRNGMSATMQAGCLLVLDDSGRVVETFSGGSINGPWDMTASEDSSGATLFVTNVLNGTVAASPNAVPGGNVVRIRLSIAPGRPPSMSSQVVIGTGLAERTDPASLVVGPTGVGLASDGTLYVADSASNRIAKITDAGTRSAPTIPITVSVGGAINDPLGLAVAPGGDILTTNGGDGNLVETAPNGTQVAVKMLDTTPAPPGPNGNGTLFGLSLSPDNKGVYFVDDGANTLNLLH